MGLANPKSQSFNFPVDEINKFSGLISRWIMSRAWHQATAFINLKTDYPLILRIKPYFVTWCAYERTIICDTPPGLSSNTSNMFLSTNSKTKKSFLFRLKNSSNWTMFSWRKLRKTRSSLFTELKTAVGYSRVPRMERLTWTPDDARTIFWPSLMLNQRQIFNSFLIVVLLTSSLSSESLNFLIATISPVSKQILLTTI